MPHTCFETTVDDATQENDVSFAFIVVELCLASSLVRRLLEACNDAVAINIETEAASTLRRLNENCDEAFPLSAINSIIYLLEYLANKR